MTAATATTTCFAERAPERFGELDPEATAAAVRGEVSDVGFGDGEFRIDPVPRVLSRAEWDPLAAGLCQRIRALERFVADVYGRQSIIRDDVIPATAVATATYFEPLMQQAVHEERRFIAIAGLDCVRGSDGVFRVLEDNVRTPSGIAYAIAARAAVAAHVPAPEGLEPIEPALVALHRALKAAAPPGVEEPTIAVLSDGPANSAFYEHEAVARALDLPLVRLADLRLRGGYLHARTEGGEMRLDVLYRRTDEDRLTHADGGLTAVAQLLLDPWCRGKLGLANAFGTGVADDKLLHAHVETMVRYYLGEEPLLESVRTWDLSRPGQLDRALERLETLVIKPRAGFGGQGVTLGPLATPAQLDGAAKTLRAAPADFVVQDFAPLSVHPTVIDGQLEPRHVDLRPFVFYGEEPEVMPGGLTRVALDEGEMVVNSSRNGGAKDTWVVA